MGGILNTAFCAGALAMLYQSGQIWLIWLPVACAIICMWSWLAMRHRAQLAARVRLRSEARISQIESGVVVPTDEDLDQIPNWMVDVNLLATTVAIGVIIWQVTIRVL